MQIQQSVSLLVLLITSTVNAQNIIQPNALAPNGELRANIKRTQYGVPHITADNLESLSFGMGYAFSVDNICILQDIIIRYNSERSKYHGADLNPGSGDQLNLISDFSYKALGIRELAEAKYNSLSINSKAVLEGYSAGVNHYLASTGNAMIDAQCANQDWVKPITPVDMLTLLFGTALFPGAGNFKEPLFMAKPPTDTADMSAIASDFVYQAPQAASNAWALGKERTENSHGLLLANPHLPFSGQLRFWQLHLTIPGSLDVMGASLYGIPGVVNVGFNQNLAWSHTYSTAEHFVIYELSLNPDDPEGMTYLLDGEITPFDQKEVTIEVLGENGTLTSVDKTSYSSYFGPMIMIPGTLIWGENTSLGRHVAYSIKDANMGNMDIIDHWLAMNLANDMDQFKAAFQSYDGMVFTNTLATDKNGNTFYIDDSTVPDLSSFSLWQLRWNPIWSSIHTLTGLSVLPGSYTFYDFSGSVPYDKSPKLERMDYVQNSNNSYWLTNPKAPLTGYSLLFGKTNEEQSLRTRMSLTMLEDSAGSDGKFSLTEVEQALFSERAYLSESIRNDLVQQCIAQGSTPVQVTYNSSQMFVNISQACQILSQWDGLYKLNSKGAVLFREFAEGFKQSPQWIQPFDATNPTQTPNGLKTGPKIMEQLARAVLKLKDANVSMQSPLGFVQFYEPTLNNGSPSGLKLFWEGTSEVEGGFNVFSPFKPDGSTLFPSHYYQTLPESQLSAEARGYQIGYGSGWIMAVEFTDTGPNAKGILTYSQSMNQASQHVLDQTLIYSNQPKLLKLPYTAAEIQANLISETEIQTFKP